MQYDYSSLSNANNLILITQFLSNSILEIKNQLIQNKYYIKAIKIIANNIFTLRRIAINSSDIKDYSTY